MLVFEIIAFELAMGISLNYDENICDNISHLIKRDVV